MKVEVITESLSYLEIAERQIDRAISLFLNEKDFISSITLAGAAEEILGKMVGEADGTHVLNDLIDGSLRLLGVDANDKKARKEVANIANYYRNRVKHYSDDGGLHFSVDFEAAEIIDRAISNYWKLTQEETPLMERFKIEVLSPDT
ncbi:hypothetical protein [Halomonas stenophila]|uniref:Superfamily II DNA or RNA helicase n=1 Tax=Halomonas stenophila TaxID=795312 RepID=A0A7W5ETG0_9GAMM|nr:hypothetical protein [Halomonas stenophila]MBB3231128.1 superfamily II DNA or RNA helicase [Halomonas stenophila]